MLREKANIMDAKAIDRAVARICYEIIERNKGVEGLCLMGILTGGAALAQRMADRIALIEQPHRPVGRLDIGRYRDDRPSPPESHDRSHIDFPVEGKKIVLVDDVLYTGRSVRAAMDAVLARGRPQSIQLAVLVDRGHRELPIRADFVGKNLPTSGNEVVKVRLTPTDPEDAVIIYTMEQPDR